MNTQDDIEISGALSPFLRVCIGVAMLSLALAPLILALGKSLHWLRWW